MLKKKLFFTLAVAGIVLLGMTVFIIMNCTSYSIYIPETNGGKYTNVKISCSDNGIVEAEKSVHENGFLKITFNALKQGETNAIIECSGIQDDDTIKIIIGINLKVGLFNVVYNRVDGMIPNISGYPVFYISAALFFSIMAVYMIIQFKDSLKKNMYSYNTIFNCSIMIILVGLAIEFLLLSVYLIFNYRSYQADQFRGLASMIMLLFILASVPFVLIYTVSMSISNISLIRHEGFRPTNSLGIIIGVLMTIGVVVCIFISMKFYMESYIATQIISNLIYSLFVFFEAFLLGTKICALIAAKHKPKLDKDYIIILGCGIRKDGTLLPLLKGRVDKAIEFYRKQLDETGKKAVFVPSGGQGSDEIISEGEAMKRYLLEQGISEEQIMPETKSTNTLENMKFSKELIEDSNANVAFSTTNYHVFRSGIFSSQAGLKAEGMGSKTKWYFWPNAFIREFVGLIVSYKTKIIFILAITAILAVAFALLTS